MPGLLDAEYKWVPTIFQKTPQTFRLVSCSISNGCWPHSLHCELNPVAEIWWIVEDFETHGCSDIESAVNVKYVRFVIQKQSPTKPYGPLNTWAQQRRQAAILHLQHQVNENQTTVPKQGNTQSKAKIIDYYPTGRQGVPALREGEP